MDTVLVIVKQVRVAFVIIPVQALLTTLTTHAPVVTAKTTPRIKSNNRPILVFSFTAILLDSIIRRQKKKFHPSLT